MEDGAAAIDECSRRGEPTPNRTAQFPALAATSPRPTITTRVRGGRLAPSSVADPLGETVVSIRSPERSGRPWLLNNLPVRAESLDFDLLAAQLIPDRLDVIGPDFPEPDLFYDSRRSFRINLRSV